MRRVTKRARKSELPQAIAVASNRTRASVGSNPMSTQVEIKDWLPGACSMTALSAISTHSGIDLAGAKAVLERCRVGARAIVETPDADRARKLVAALEAVGYLANVCD